MVADHKVGGSSPLEDALAGFLSILLAVSGCLHLKKL